MALSKTAAHQLQKITTLHARHRDMLEAMMMAEIRRQMFEFSRRLKPSTKLRLDCGMGTCDFRIERRGLPTLWLSSTDIWYQQTKVGGHPHLLIPPRAMRSEVLYPLLQCLEFINDLQSNLGLYPESHEVMGRRGAVPV